MKSVPFITVINAHLFKGVLNKYLEAKYVQQSDASVVKLSIKVFLAVTTEIHAANNIQKYLVIKSSRLLVNKINT